MRKMLFCYALKKIVKCFIVINIQWIILSTVIPNLVKNNSLFQPNNALDFINHLLVNSNVVVVIAHPDDEVMFFAPSIIELNRPQYNNTLSIVCFSNGNADGLGSIRSKELYHSAKIFGLPSANVFQINDEENFKDGVTITWDSSTISSHLDHIITQLASRNKKRTLNLLTFDEAGVSNHANHKSLYHGAKQYATTSAKYLNVQLFKLNSLSFIQKYSFTILTSKLIFVKYYKALRSIYQRNTLQPDTLVVDPLDVNNTPYTKIIQISSDLPSVILTLAAMSFAHDSQMVWFRWGWLLFSRFINFNELIVD